MAKNVWLILSIQRIKAVEMKLQGYTTKQVMQELNIKNETQVKTWFRWYKNGETHRFHQQGGETIFL